MVLSICEKFHQNIWNGFELRERTREHGVHYLSIRSVVHYSLNTYCTSDLLVMFGWLLAGC